jgi:DNA invertase Pin-like site-specific DNA recombinase
MATRAIGYVRVSTEQQADFGVSLEAQKAKLTAYCALYDVELVEVIVDAGVSAKTLNRPGLSRALAMLKSGAADALIVAKLDRLTRSVRDLGELVETYFAKSALLSVAEQIDTRSAGGRLVLNVLASVSQWEREAIGERTSAAMQHMAAEGIYTGGKAPYGFKVEAGELVEVAGEQAVLSAARELKASGLSLRAIAQALASRGFTSRTGRAFGAQSVAGMVAA